MKYTSYIHSHLTFIIITFIYSSVILLNNSVFDCIQNKLVCYGCLMISNITYLIS